ncbi:patatin-like phospholipase family protein [Herbaspirillum huttiense F1]|uniref:patatin-like phospholipase family protein n=1 Tax=Herbaspirillum huttiense TaxID=863372 RepID=UPI0028855182|nr:patatin-like phospholipase family protein [Herbaspirillum huttiense]MDT0359340.1 patatin-like phospholipase family protein [Herbaspirillum huttiense F1]
MWIELQRAPVSRYQLFGLRSKLKSFFSAIRRIRILRMEKEIHLSLSGGGFRAAFFHLGALYALAENGTLQRTKLIVSVSGGSIAAAALMSEWSKAIVGTTPPGKEVLQSCVIRAFEFLYEKAEGNPRARAMGSIRALNSLIVHGEIGFGKAMSRQYKQWFESADVISPVAASIMPEWRIAASDYLTGKRVMVVSNDHGQSRSKDAIYLDCDDIGLGQAIGASAAVPGIFEPIRWKEFQLGDGGVLDNHGVRELEDTNAIRICFDASAKLQEIDWQSGWSAPVRAMDMLMEQVRADRFANGVEIHSLRDSISNGALPSWRKKISELRTDLDDFTSSEMSLSFLAGYQTAMGSSAVPQHAPFEKKRSARKYGKATPKVRMMWQIVSDIPGIYDKEASKIYHDIMDGLERGKYKLFAGLKHRTLTSVITWFFEAYMTLAICFVAAIYAGVSFLGFSSVLGLMDKHIAVAVAVLWLACAGVLFFALSRDPRNKWHVAVAIVRILLLAPLSILASVAGLIIRWNSVMGFRMDMAKSRLRKYPLPLQIKDFISNSANN